MSDHRTLDDEAIMNTETITRRLRGVVGNAVVWGAAWSASALVVFAALKAGGFLQDSVIWLDSILVAARFGFAGAIAGAAFSALVGPIYRGHRLAEISALRFGLGGAVLGGLFVPGFLTVARLLSGDGLLPLESLLLDGSLSALFGGVAAGASLKLAQHADPLLGGGDSARLGRGDRLATVGGETPARRQPAR
jgi:hypothetical protein